MKLKGIFSKIDYYMSEFLNPSYLLHSDFHRFGWRKTENYAYYSISKVIEILLIIILSYYLHKLGQVFVYRRREKWTKIASKCLIWFIAVWVPIRFVLPQIMNYVGHFGAWSITFLPRKAENMTLHIIKLLGPYLDWLELILILVVLYFTIFPELHKIVKTLPGLRKAFARFGTPTIIEDERRPSTLFIPSHTRRGTVYQPIDYEELNDSERVKAVHITHRH